MTITKKKLNWNQSFRDFPPIPKCKQWLKEIPNTPEQLIVQKLLNKQNIEKQEEELLSEAIDYYEQLISKLKFFDLKTLKETEIQEFKDFFFYAFNHIVMEQNGLIVRRVVRLVRNKSVLKERERIRNQKYLSYPSKELVKELNLYNRANTPDYNVFYGADCIDTVLNEIKPLPDDLVTVGVWDKIDKSKPLISYPITHNPMAIAINPDAKKGFMAFQVLKQSYHPLLMKFLETIFNFISDEFAKPVEHHKSYFYSAIFSEKILFHNFDPKWKYDCIVYPSVGNRYSVDNLAILPDTIDREFKLKKVIEFEVTETHYEKLPKRIDQEEITLVGYKNLETTDWIENNGDIVW